MTDRITAEARSRTMASIRRKGTSMEKVVEGLIQKSRFSFVMHPPWLGSPDFAFQRRGVVVFLDSCFWHKCPEHFRPPKSRTTYWEAKISRNVARDFETRAKYRELGWEVLQFWEHSVAAAPKSCLENLIKALRNRKPCSLIPPPPKRTPGGGVRFQ